MTSTEWLLLLALSALWGGSFFFAKVAVQEISRYRGSQFDAGVVDAFLDAWARHENRPILAAIAAGAPAPHERLERPLAVGERRWHS